MFTMEKGAYIFYTENDDIDLFIFMKCTSEELHNALPLNSSRGEILDDHDTLHAIFHKGADYLGSGCLQQIPEIIDKLHAVDLINNSFETLKNLNFPTLTRKNYNYMIDFCKSQLEKV